MPVQGDGNDDAGKEPGALHGAQHKGRSSTSALSRSGSRYLHVEADDGAVLIRMQFDKIADLMDEP